MEVQEVELTAAQIDAQADQLVDQMKANNWQVPAEAKPEAPPTEAKADADTQPSAESTDNKQAPDQPPEKAPDLNALAEIVNRQPEIKDPLQFSVQLPAGYEEARAALFTQREDALEKMMAGDISAKEFAEVERKVFNGLDELRDQKIRAETLIEVNNQTSASTQAAVLQSLMARAKDQVDYTDPTASSQFDRQLRAEFEDPANAGKPFAALAEQAHQVVLLKRGVLVKASNEAPKRDVPNTPVTLGGLPNAGAAGEKTVTQVLAGLSGPDFDKAFDALPKDQQEKFLKQA
jgi:hypothetical protein